MMTSSDLIDAELVSPVVAPPDRSASRQTGRMRYHIGALLLSILVLAACLSLEVSSPTQVSVPWIGVTLPGTCLWREVFGVDCPGCGMTRCFVSLAHGDVAAGWAFHPTGLLLFAALIYQIPYRTLQIIRLAKGRHEMHHDRMVVCCGIVVALLLVQWVGRTFF